MTPCGFFCSLKFNQCEFDVTEKYSDNYEIKYVIPNAVRNLQKILRRCRSSE